MSFRNFPLQETLLANIDAVGYTEPSAIQSQVIPLALEGQDVSGLSRTGTGKTAAFLIPTIHRLSQLAPDRLALCLAPTRELAIQIEEETKKLAKDMNIRAVSVVGGMSAEDQIRALKEGARIVAGTPGRIIDLFKEGALNLEAVEVLVFDEADRMFDMGFIKDMEYLMRKINPKRQILLFSATMNFSVLNMMYEFGSNPTEVNVSRDQMTADKIEQLIYQVGDSEKPKALLAAIKKHAAENATVIVFVNYKERVLWVAELLKANGISAQGISSMLRQEKRNKIIQGFKQGRFRALVATDVASRGIDIDDIQLVVNYHLPEEAATYVHRIGRTARAGKSGIAVSIASSEDAYNQIRVEEFLKQAIPAAWFEDGEMPTEIKMPSRSQVERAEAEDGEATEDNRQGQRNHSRERGPRPERGDRHGRGRDRSERSDRPERGERPQRAHGEHANQERREPRERRDNRDRREPREDRRHHENGGRHGHRDSGREEQRGRFMAPPDMPSPLTGNPVIYCMKTGKAKNRTDTEYKDMVADYQSRVVSSDDKSSGRKKPAPAIIKKISSKVSALFGAKRNAE